MASSALGEPMTRRNAVVLWSAQPDKGTPVTPATAAGIWTVSKTRHSSNQSFRGPGSANFVARKGGSTYTEWSMQSEAVQSGMKNLLLRAARTSSVLPWTTFGWGYKDDVASPVRSADQVQDCKIGSLGLNLDASSGHGPLSASMSGVGGLVTAVTSLDPATLSSTPWMTYEGVYTKAGSAYPVRTFSTQIEHNLSRDHVIPGALPASFVRGHFHVTEHDEVITGSLTRYAKTDVAIQANTISQFALQIVLTNLVDSATLTLAFATADFDFEKEDEDANGIFWTTDFEAKTLTIS